MRQWYRANSLGALQQTLEPPATFNDYSNIEQLNVWHQQNIPHSFDERSRLEKEKEMNMPTKPAIMWARGPVLDMDVLDGSTTGTIGAPNPGHWMWHYSTTTRERNGPPTQCNGPKYTTRQFRVMPKYIGNMWVFMPGSRYLEPQISQPAQRRLL